MECRFGAKFGRDVGMFQNRLDFRTPDDAVVIDGIVQRFDAETVTYQHQSLFTMVVENDGELAPQLLYKGESIAQIHRQGNCAIALAATGQCLAGELGAYAFVAIQFAVYRHRVIAVVRLDRLVSVIEPDDGKPSVAKCQSLIDVESAAAFVGPAMVEHVKHLVEREAQFALVGTGGIPKSSDATHGKCSMVLRSSVALTEWLSKSSSAVVTELMWRASFGTNEPQVLTRR